MRLWQVSLVLAILVACGTPDLLAPDAPCPGKLTSPSGVRYCGGPVFEAGTHVAVIYWSRDTIFRGGPSPGSSGAGTADTSLIGYLLNRLGDSPLWGVLSTYTGPDGGAIRASLTYDRFLADTVDVPSHDSTVVWGRFAQEAAKLAAPNTVVVIFTGPGVWPAGLAGCAFHESAGAVIYAVIPYAFDTNCEAAIPRTAPNDPAVDAIATSLVHELAESATDPMPFSGWTRSDGSEIADLCNRNYGAVYTTPNGGLANIRIGDRDFLLQSLWLNVGAGRCAMSK